jgi:putative transcriptional regulator
MSNCANVGLGNPGVNQKASIINEKLDSQIQKTGLTQCELSKKSGLSKAMICMMVNGKKTNVRPRTISRLCRALNCKPQDIFEQEENI